MGEMKFRQAPSTREDSPARYAGWALLHSERTMHPMSIYYRTKDGRADYKFSFEWHPRDGYRIYIDDQPGYGGRDTSADATHRLSDGGRKYVCWTEPIRSEVDAQQIAAQWADCTQEYIRTGKRFGGGLGR